MSAGARACAVAAVVVATACGVMRGQSGPGAYDRLDQARLADELSRLRMTELLEEMVRENTAAMSPRNLWAAVQAKLSQADVESGDPEKRQLLLDEASAMVSRLIDSNSKPATREDEIARERYRFTYMDILGRMEPRLGAEELLMLLGGEGDRKLIAEHTAKVLLPASGEGAAMLDSLQSQIDASIKACRQSSRDLILFAPQLERLKDEVRYSAAWICLYRGLALSDAESRRRLHQAIELADRFAKGETDEGVQDPACLYLQGVAWMLLGAQGEKGGFENAAQAFDAAAASAQNAKDANLLVRIDFQRVHNQIESGQFAPAAAAAERFAAQAVQRLGPTAGVQADVSAALLKNYLYLRWAAADLAQRDALRAKAQQAMLDFLEKHRSEAGVSAAFLNVVGRKYALDPDVEKLHPVVQMAVAENLYDEGMAAAKSDPQASRKKFERAAEVLRSMLQSGDPSAVAMRAKANQRLGLVLSRMGGNPAAAMDAFASAGGNDDLLNACIVGKNALAAAGAGETPALRQKYIEVLRKLLAIPDRPDLAVWNIDLAEQYRSLCGRSVDAAGLENLSNAIAAYNAVPAANVAMYLEARHRAMSLEFARMDAMKKLGASGDRLDGQAKELIEQVRQYVGQVRAARKSADGNLGRNLLEWGADAEFLAAIVQYEQLHETAAAMAALAKLPADWPGAAVLGAAKEYEIRKLIENHDTLKAVAEIDALNDRQPRQAADLMQLVMMQLRDRIARLRNDPSAGSELTQARQAYLEFAGQLLRKYEKSGEAAAYPYRQMYADAQLENGQAKQALAAFESLNAVESQQRQAREAAVDADVDKLLRALDAAGSNADSVRKLAEELPAQMKAWRIDPESRGYVQTLRIAVSYLDKAPPDAGDLAIRVKAVADRLQAAYLSLRKDLKNAIPRDSNNLWGLARANWRLKDYSRALPMYKRLVDGLDPAAYRAQYGLAQLELCQCSYEAAMTEPDLAIRKKHMGFLKLRIDELGRQEGDFWGYKAPFEQLGAMAEQAAR